MDRRTHGRTDNLKTVYPKQTKFAGGIKETSLSRVMGYKLFLKARRVFKFDNYNGTDLTTGLRSGCEAVIWKDSGHPTTVIVTEIFVSSSSLI